MIMRIKIQFILVLLLICINSFSQDYAILFYSNRTGNQEIFIQYPDQNDPVNLTNNPAKDVCPAISPNGEEISFLSNRDGYQNIYTMNIDGSNVQKLTSDSVTIHHPAWSSDGLKILYVKDH